MKTEAAYPNDARCVAHARRFVIEAIGHAPPDLLADVQLMTSELVSNALLHASSGYTVSVEAHDQVVVVAVTDAGGGRPTVRSPGDEELSGRGLMIVAALARAWGIDQAARADGDDGAGEGKTVWFSVELPRTTDPTDQASATVTPISERHGAPAMTSRPSEARPMRRTLRAGLAA